MRTIVFAAAIGIATTLSAIGGPQDHIQLPERGMKEMAMTVCPMKTADVDLSVEDVSDGIRLTFTTKSGDVARIRRHVEAFSKMHSASATKDVRGNMMPFTTTYEVLPEGARITLKPRDPQKLEEFRAKVREHSVKTKDGTCAAPESMNHEPDHRTHHPWSERRP
jgi:hypothetical protein